MTGGSPSLNSSTDTTIYDPSADGPATAFFVTNPDSTNDILVHQNGVQKTGEYAPIGPGLTITFGKGGENYNGLGKIVAKSSAGTIVAKVGIVGVR